ncbi:hypothetical protein SMKI_10G2250 [Saccharomyces mikatae IFO 1815]|uniref:YJR030C-like protein n=1 Tax=Saccharomyces mikatae IFO 1815 TaxID=226126 RepID=A0AA35IQR7_SACMI|nr:uncharacterized protein SMKI_10G2250 [Saccharomyces mikatae IFO 1815]CAI4034434.1 hypothetical protein SMKI_10G2250 [Saccharomyces mikatae IFO 1815]
MDLFNKEEASFQGVLKRLLDVCKYHSRYRGSNLDPMVKVGTEMSKISSYLKCILLKHSAAHDSVSLTQSNENPYKSLFKDVQLLDLYHHLLFGCVRLLFDEDMPYFRMNSQKLFPMLLFKVYYKLRDVSYATNEMRLGSLISAFVYYFKSRYDFISCNSLKYESVRDIMSREFCLINPPLIDLEQVVKRAYYRLDIEKFTINNKLVEIFELESGHIAIFEVLSGEMPYTLQTIDNLFQSLASGNHDLMNVGRSLLFRTFRSEDLDVVKIDDNGVKLKTAMGNGIVLRLTCKDPIQWQAHWKHSIKKNFDPTAKRKNKESENKNIQHSDVRHNMTNHFSSQKNIDVPIGPIEPSNTIHNGRTLHRSTLLPGNLSSLIEASQKFPKEESISVMDEEVAIDNTSDLDTSLKDIESLSCEKLIELDRSMHVPLSPKYMDTPTLQNVRTASQVFSLESVSPELIENVASEIDDTESIISEEEKGKGGKDLFDPDVDYYKPTLYRRKSSSLLSIFTKNKKNLTIDIPKNPSGSLFSLPGDQQSLTPVSANSCDDHIDETYVSFPLTVEASTSAVLFENDSVKASLWNGKSWAPLSKGKMCLSLISSRDNGTLLIIYKDFEREKCKLVARLEPNWKCNRSTAQDVQLRMSSSDLRASVFERIDDITLSIRCIQAARLMSVLQHQVQNSQTSSLSPSATARTLSTIASSSCFSRNVTRSSTEKSELANMKDASESINSSLLLSSVKVRQHVKTKSNIWKPSRVGFTDIFSQEYKGVVIAIKFVICSDAEGTLYPREYNSRLHDIKRIGRTGLSFADQEEAYLLEFKEQNVVDHVYKLFMPFNTS